LPTIERNCVKKSIKFNLADLLITFLTQQQEEIDEIE
jgi:hypothetical protein